ncbi:MULTISPECIES: ThiF family adenylyltransferase [unclassified Bradyrhizobium]|uniref:ThiF family adenylyltransferase n=1 Tax=unclassified Bradyrhizobium TaxID=2631580 RepID=UPI002478C191|nr:MULTISPECIES: ThiF family adenylyltransferase [unclassified Bradyrhizobium]WGS23930.1 ThiF family adenylyltransferase [Bradyrhizobium sp. ISRA463]WGS31243.1 ThiF family adenylyltransferase [Bradyrhizobium sp. ISRA464]
MLGAHAFGTCFLAAAYLCPAAACPRRRGELLDELLREPLPRTFVSFGVLADSGPALATVVVKRPAVVRGRDPLTAGFRPSIVPEHVARSRFFGGEQCDRHSIERVDPAWIHGRDRDARVPRLRGCVVALLGCGSVGAPVAHALARSGVGKLILVDKQMLKSANVGRHTLGVESIDDRRGRTRHRMPVRTGADPASTARRPDEGCRRRRGRRAGCRREPRSRSHGRPPRRARSNRRRWARGVPGQRAIRRVGTQRANRPAPTRSGLPRREGRRRAAAVLAPPRHGGRRRREAERPGSASRVPEPSDRRRRCARPARRRRRRKTDTPRASARDRAI